jgi:hypothetical protein
LTKKDNKDLTRIEDLSEFLHDLNEDFSDLEEAGGGDEPPGLPNDDDDFLDMATDPDIKLPKGFHDQGETPDFNALENNPEDFQMNDSADDTNLEEAESIPDFAQSEEEDFQGQFEQQDIGSTNEFSDTSFEEDTFESNEFEAPEFDSAEFSNEDFTNDEFQEEVFSAQENSNEDFSDEFEQEDFETNENKDNTEIEETQSFENETTQSEVLHSDGPEEDFFDEPIEETATKTPLPTYEVAETFKAPENFKELQQFARNMSYGNMAKEGNPPFSVILKDIKYEEDLEDIVRLLREYKIITQEDESNARASLRRGSMLIPRLGEFAAISLCHNLRRFEISILMGLTEEVHPARDYESDDRGLTTKHNIYNNKKHHWQFEKEAIKLQDIIIATTPYIDGHDILEYISVVTESTMVDLEDFSSNSQLAKELASEVKKTTKSNLDFYPSASTTEASSSITLNDIYQSLIEKCRAHALNQKGNALIGINFAITPLIADGLGHLQTRYQITCSGSVVWIKKR